MLGIGYFQNLGNPMGFFGEFSWNFLGTFFDCHRLFTFSKVNWSQSQLIVDTLKLS
jgi:hypothetical protein